MNIRKTLKYPPFYYLANLIFKSKDYEKVAKEAKKAKSYLEQNLDNNYIILGPTAANVFMMNKIYHLEISIKYKNKDLLMPVLKDLFTYTKVDLDIDFNF